MCFESDIFRLLMLVLLMANDKQGAPNNFYTDINQILIFALIAGSTRYPGTCTPTTSNLVATNLTVSNLTANNISANSITTNPPPSDPPAADPPSQDPCNP